MTWFTKKKVPVYKTKRVLTLIQKRELTFERDIHMKEQQPQYTYQGFVWVNKFQEENFYIITVVDVYSNGSEYKRKEFKFATKKQAEEAFDSIAKMRGEDERTEIIKQEEFDVIKE